MENSSAKSFSLPWGFSFSVLLILILGLTWKAVLLLADAFPFNADEAIVGLMGRHILTGAQPVFFYGQAYMGSLDAYLVALGFRLFGSEVWVIRLVQIILYLGTILTTILIALRLHIDRLGALVSGLLIAIPTVNVTLYTTVSLGGYGEALLIGNLILLLTLRLMDHDVGVGHYLLWGFLAGLGFWAFGLTLIYSIPSFLLLVSDNLKKNVALFKLRSSAPLLLGFIVGVSPVIFWGFKYGWGTLIHEFLGAAIAGASPGNFWLSLKSHVLNLIMFGPTVILGIRPPWSTETLAQYLVPFIVLFWSLVVLHTILRRSRVDDRRSLVLLGLVVLSLIIGFVLTPFGADPSGRYFIPLWVPLAIMAGEFIVQPILKIPSSLRLVLLAGALIFNAISTWQTAQTIPDRITTQFDSIARVDHGYDQELIDFLLSVGETRGYSNYWTAYPIAFLSNEEIIFYPALPYHLDYRYTPRDNRYDAYVDIVNQSPQVAYITTNHPLLDNELRENFSRRNVSWEEKYIGDYVVFFNLSDRVDIQEVDQAWKVPGS